MREQEEQYIKHEVKTVVMPDIKAMIPGFIGFILRTFLPKIEKRLIEHIMRIAQMLLDWQKLQKD